MYSELFLNYNKIIMSKYCKITSFKTILFLLILVLFVSCSSDNEKKLELSGCVEVIETHISFRIGGNVMRMSVREGQEIYKGDTIAQLDPTELLLALSIKEAELSSAKAAFSKLEGGLRPQEIGLAYSILMQTRAKFTQVQDNYKRMKELYETGNISQQDYEAAQTEYEVAKTQVDIAGQKYSLASEGYQEEDIKAALGIVTIAENAHELADIQLSYTVLISPLDGVIITTYVEEGENIGQGTPVISIVKIDSVKVKFWISGNNLGKIKLDQEVLIINDTYSSEPMRGMITSISQEAEFTPSMIQTEEERVSLVYEINALIPNENMVLKPGMPVIVEIPLEK